MKNFREACELVLAHCSNPYAKAYARAGLSLSSPSDAACQALYVLSNVNHWRGPIAQRAKSLLREVSKNA